MEWNFLTLDQTRDDGSPISPSVFCQPAARNLGGTSEGLEHGASGSDELSAVETICIDWIVMLLLAGPM